MTGKIDKSILESIRNVCGISVLTIGTLACIGWIANIDLVTRISHKYIPMALDTSVAFILCGLLLLSLGNAQSSRPSRIPLVAGVSLISIYGLLKALEFFLKTDLTFANVLFPAKEYLGTHIVNRMSPLTGALFLFSGIGIIAASYPNKRTLQWVGRIGAFVGGSGLLLFYAYLLGEPFLYHSTVIPLSALTAFAFCLLGMGLLVHAGSDSVLRPFLEATIKSRALRLFVPLIIFTCFVQQLLYRWSSETELSRALVYFLVPLAAALIAAIAGTKLAQYLSDRLTASYRLVEESEAKYRSVVEYSHDMYWTLDPAGNFVYANKKCSDVTGFELADLIGRSFVPLLHEEDIARVIDIFSRALNGEPQEYEVNIPRADGSELFLEVTSVPNYNLGKVIGVASFGKDITARKLAEQESRKREELLRESQFVARLGSYDLDISAGKWTSSSVLDEIFGINDAFDRTPENWLSLVHPEWRETMAHYLLEEVIGKGQRFNKEYKIVRFSDGRECWVHGLGDLEFDNQGNAVRMIGTIQDITDRKLLEAEREKLTTQLRQVQRLETIGTLAGGVAHDFNNILTPILVYSDLVANDLGDSHPLRQDIEHVISAAHRAKDLVKQILTFSRQTDHVRVPMELSPIVKEAMKLLKASLPSTISMEAHIQPDPAKVLADPSQIHQVLMNLGTNAAHAMQDHGGILKIVLETVTVTEETAREVPRLTAGEFVRLSVSDTGCGMDEMTRERIFEPFFTTKAVGEGTGLGLSVVHGIIESHSGAITVSSAVGKGSKFDVYLPLIHANEFEQDDDEQDVLGGRERILIVDDEEDVAVALKDVLAKRYGYVATVITKGREALDYLRAHPDEVDLLIVDETMPEITGMLLAREAQTICRGLPIILMTGYTQKFDDTTCRQFGIARLMLKPPDPKELGRTVRSVLDMLREESARAS